MRYDALPKFNMVSQKMILGCHFQVPARLLGLLASQHGHTAVLGLHHAATIELLETVGVPSQVAKVN